MEFFSQGALLVFRLKKLIIAYHHRKVQQWRAQLNRAELSGATRQPLYSPYLTPEHSSNQFEFFLKFSHDLSQ